MVGFKKPNGFRKSRVPAMTSRNMPLTNKPIKSIYKKAKKAPRTKAAVNQKAITTLSRQVKSLQLQRFGKVQSHTFFWEMAPPFVNSINQITAGSVAPWCWQLNDFLDPCAMYFGHSPTAGVTTGVRFPNNFVPQTYTAAAAAGNWNKQRNLELASIHSYKPILSKFTLSINCQLPDAFTPQRLRVTVLKIKPFSQSITQDTALPTALGNYANLALEPGDPQRNYLWKKYHTILYDKTLIVRNTLDTEYRQFTIPFTHRYGPNEIVSPHLTSDPTGQEVYMNTPVSSQIWVLVSWSDPLVQTISKVRVSRFDVWRDTLGHNETTSYKSLRPPEIEVPLPPLPNPEPP